MASYEQSLSDQMSGIWTEEGRSCGDKCSEVVHGSENTILHGHHGNQDVEEIRNYVTKTAKYLYDGHNLIKIKERRAPALLAEMAKADAVKRNVQATMTGDAASCKFHGYIWDFVAPESQLGVPWIVYGIIKELEGRGKQLKGDLYLQRVDREEIRKMKWLFKNEGTPKLQDVDSNVLANTLLSFLCDLKEPLIPVDTWELFIAAGQVEYIAGRVEALKRMLALLPKVNRKTIGLLVNHLKKIARETKSMVTEMDLARVFAPVVVGYSGVDRGTDRDEFYRVVRTMYGLMQVDVELYFN